jgi:hypothetical protein
MIRDYQGIVSYQKQLAMEKVEETATMKDLREAPGSGAGDVQPTAGRA